MTSSDPQAGHPRVIVALGSQTLGWGKLVCACLAFLILTVSIFWYQFHRIRAGDATPR